MSKDQIIQKLKDIRGNVDPVKNKGVTFVSQAEFKNWKDIVIKWLNLGLPYTENELKKFQNLKFIVRRMRMNGQGYDLNDQNQYDHDCDYAISLLDSAIENLEHGYSLGAAKKPELLDQSKGSSKYSGIHINQAGAVVMGDSNIVNIVDSTTILQFLGILEKEIKMKIHEPEQRESLLQKIKKISENPTIAAVLSQTLGQVLRGTFVQ